MYIIYKITPAPLKVYWTGVFWGEKDDAEEYNTEKEAEKEAKQIGGIVEKV